MSSHLGDYSWSAKQREEYVQFAFSRFFSKRERRSLTIVRQDYSGDVIFLYYRAYGKLRPITMVYNAFLSNPFFRLIHCCVHGLRERFFTLFCNFFRFFMSLLQGSYLRSKVVGRIASGDLCCVSVLARFVSPFCLLAKGFRLV